MHKGYQYARIDGQTAGEDREESIDTFNKPNSPMFAFLLSTRYFISFFLIPIHFVLLYFLYFKYIYIYVFLDNYVYIINLFIYVFIN